MISAPPDWTPNWLGDITELRAGSNTEWLKSMAKARRQELEIAKGRREAEEWEVATSAFLTRATKRALHQKGRTESGISPAEIRFPKAPIALDRAVTRESSV